MAPFSTQTKEAVMAEKKEPATYKVRILRDFWPTESDRVAAGTVAEMTDADEVMTGIEKGLFERVKDE
jgi:hypothetical protein